jgi:hypothetical protein
MLSEKININSQTLFDDDRQLALSFMTELNRDEGLFPSNCPSCGSTEFVQACRMPCPRCGFVLACNE